jgi:hypothetical protein
MEAGMKAKAVKENKWLKNQQKLHASDIAEVFHLGHRC